MMLNRRHLGWGHCLCRLPLLALWTLIVIFFLYKSITSSYPYKEAGQLELPPVDTQQALRWTTSPETLARPEMLTTAGITLPNQLPHQTEDSPTHFSSSSMKERMQTPRARMAVVDSRGSRRPVLSTTRKSPVSEYARQSEIFILIVQEEDIRSMMGHRSSNNNPESNVKSFSSYSSGTLPVGPSLSASSSSRARSDRHKLVIRPHVQQLIEILDSHRISYTIDTTLHGTPSQLLDLSKRKFSVMVIDDFLRYTKLNRWLRDQLDRYCRSNQIGVITYLIDSHKLDLQFASEHSSIGSSKNHDVRTRASKPDPASTFKVMTTDQFPLAVEPIQNECLNQSSAQCLIDYQVNDNSQVLRILKPRPDFIVRGQVPTSVVAMSSNHVTYEPLTWARLRVLPSSSSTEGRHRRHTSSSTLKLAGTRHSYHDDDRGGVARGLHARRARAVLPNPPRVDVEPGASDNFQGLAGRDERSSSAPRMNDQTTPGGGGQADQNADEYGLEVDQDHQESGNHNGHATSSDHLGGDDQSSSVNVDAGFAQGGERKILAMFDRGLYDDIRRVIFGVTNAHWLNRALLLDAIEHLSSGEIMTPLERYIQIDIDDIFVGSSGTRLNRSDVEALLEAQNVFARTFEGGFKFNLGFSGKYFKRGNEAEQAGDEMLIENADKFTWFCHFWSHSKAHLFNNSHALATQELMRNLKFARDKKLTLVGHPEPLKLDDNQLDDEQQLQGQLPPTYAVAPHHSGVYPIHEQLYEAWRSILNVQVTSTEEYPHLRPASQRRGFVHKTIKVLPRQTCGLYTHTIFKDKYPGGFEKLLANIRGGELFQTVLHNPVNIYMSHMSNYANDRLALLTFKELFEFVRENTNLRLKFAPSSPELFSNEDGREHADFGAAQLTGPLFLANYYFALHPDEREPLWTNPCDDKRHLAIWSAEKQQGLCEVVPKVLIVGPQKTGTTALQTFLKLNPSIRTSLPSQQDFEEVQFFNDKHYSRGSDWYFERFASPAQVDTNLSSSQELFYIDKSATYFGDPKVPRRASALLPNAHIVILLIDPADRAHSWYQHIRAHGNDEVANWLTFEEVIMFEDGPQDHHPANDSSRFNSLLTIRGQVLSGRQVASVKSLRARCLQPGYYSSHLLKWLDFYPSRQVIIIDGEWFKYNPVAVLNRLQLLLRLPQQVDYANLLSYSESKGFFCEVVSHSSQDIGEPKHEDRQQFKCLGSGKGRRYDPMSQAAREYLDKHYLAHNRQLARLLYDIGQPLPTWLDESINSLPVNSRRRKHRALD